MGGDRSRPMGSCLHRLCCSTTPPIRPSIYATSRAGPSTSLKNSATVRFHVSILLQIYVRGRPYCCFYNKWWRGPGRGRSRRTQPLIDHLQEAVKPATSLHDHLLFHRRVYGRRPHLPIILFSVHSLHIKGGLIDLSCTVIVDCPAISLSLQ